MANKHSFHIPVMGIGYTVDTPLKVSHLGINSVISLVDDELLEKLREMYCGKNDLTYHPITKKTEDFRAKRITSYLNMIKNLTERKFEELKNSLSMTGNDIKEYFSILPDNSSIKQEFLNIKEKYFNSSEIRNWIKDNLSMGSIDVNIMTKIDKDNYLNGEKLPVEYNDAHAALRGYANSDLNSSLVLSAGMNPRLYSYMEKFEDFYPDQDGIIKKRIILKVSDYRSALIQGKFLAKKGLWVSEYRVESGLNCGGHAFATDGYLMGPILAEFRDKRSELSGTLYEMYFTSLASKNRSIPNIDLPLRITAQGGVGTAEEHNFLLEHYNIDAVGWGTPFLLVPEAVTVDPKTLTKLIEAKEDDLYLSNVSPLGVPFNNLRGNTKDEEKSTFVAKGRPGSSCPKEYVKIYNKEFTERSICTASRQYQYLKLKQLDEQNLHPDGHRDNFDKIVDKACICVGLGTSVLLANDLSTRVEGEGVSVCPGPNMAYFSKVMSLKEITDHIYGRINVISRTDRPHMFIKELTIYIEYLKSKIEETRTSVTDKQEKYLRTFIKNLEEGINYYDNLFNELKDKFKDTRSAILKELDSANQTLKNLILEIESLSLGVVK